MSRSTTSAASTESPDLKVRSMVRPLFKLRTLTRLKACPLPGLTISFSTIQKDFHAGLKFAGVVAGHFFLAVPAPKWVANDTGNHPGPPAGPPVHLAARAGGCHNRS